MREPLGVVCVETNDGRTTAAVESVLGYRPSDVTTFEQWLALYGDQADAERARLRATTEGEICEPRDVVLTHSDGRPCRLELSTLRARSSIVLTLRNCTDRPIRLEEAERIAGLGAWTWNTETGVATVSNEFKRIVGIDDEDYVPGFQKFASIVHEDDRERFRTEIEAAISERRPTFEVEIRVVRPDGSLRWVTSRAELFYPPDGSRGIATGVLQDITAHKLLEERLRQVQKLEALGLLAAGVAHDFNNLLMVTSSFAELCLSQLAPGERARDGLVKILGTVTRGASLTRQLLAFSRRQLTQPKSVDPNEIVRSVETMLHRLIREDVRIEITTAAVGRVFVDPGQLEQVLINLAVSARDAMPGGGRLAIMTSNVLVDGSLLGVGSGAPLAPGNYVLLSVGDTGVGLDRETQERVFDPFSTTSDPGVGSGLGLATACGIVQQAGGDIRLVSAPGAGTTINVYLPLAKQTASWDRPLVDAPTPTTGSETILLVEDDETIRGLVAQVLEERGYRVLTAANGQAALQMAASAEEKIDLVFTDVVMPTLGGRALVDTLRSARPGIAVLLMSGYAADDRLRNEIARGDVHLLEKPFRADAAAIAVRRAIDAKRTDR